MKLLSKVGVTILIGAAISLTGVTAANAADLYQDINYSGYLESRTSGNLSNSHNDIISSVIASGAQTYCENKGCTGRKVTLTGSYNDLRSVNTGLGLGETWTDRISALQ